MACHQCCIEDKQCRERKYGSVGMDVSMADKKFQNVETGISVLWFCYYDILQVFLSEYLQ